MSDTTTRSAMHANNAVPRHPADVLLAVLVNLLAPLFLDGSGGDIRFACMAARATVEDYRATSRMDLLSVAQIIAFGLGALGSLGLSMMDNLDVRLILRLRSNAAALNRAAEQNRRALERSQAATPHRPAEDRYSQASEREMLETLQQTEILFAELQMRQAAQADKTMADDPTYTDEAIGEAVLADAVAPSVAVSGSASPMAIDPSIAAAASGATLAPATLQDMPTDAAGQAMALDQWQHAIRLSAMREAEADHAAEVAARALSAAQPSPAQSDITGRIAALSGQARASLAREAAESPATWAQDAIGLADAD